MVEVRAVDRYVEDLGERSLIYDQVYARMVELHGRSVGLDGSQNYARALFKKAGVNFGVEDEEFVAFRIYCKQSKKPIDARFRQAIGEERGEVERRRVVLPNR